MQTLSGNLTSVVSVPNHVCRPEVSNWNSRLRGRVANFWQIWISMGRRSEVQTTHEATCARLRWCIDELGAKHPRRRECIPQQNRYVIASHLGQCQSSSHFPTRRTISQEFSRHSPHDCPATIPCVRSYLQQSLWSYMRVGNRRCVLHHCVKHFSSYCVNNSASQYKLPTLLLVHPRGM